MDNIQIAKEWFEYGEMDLKTAIYLLDMRPKPNEIICYHCQQSAEKYLKGYLIIVGETIKKTHDLQFLCKLASKKNGEIKKLEEDCIELTDYSVEVRYPFHVDIDGVEVDNAMKSALKIKDTIMNIVNLGVEE